VTKITIVNSSVYHAFFIQETAKVIIFRCKNALITASDMVHMDEYWMLMYRNIFIFIRFAVCYHGAGYHIPSTLQTRQFEMLLLVHQFMKWSSATVLDSSTT